MFPKTTLCQQITFALMNNWVGFIKAHVLFYKETMEALENFNITLRLAKFIQNLESVSMFVSPDYDVGYPPWFTQPGLPITLMRNRDR